MRKVTINKADFDEVVYPALAMRPLGQVFQRNPQKQEQARRQLYKLLDALEEKASPRVADADYPMFALDEPVATFELDDAQADVLADYLEYEAGNLMPLRARKIEGLIHRAKNGDPDIDENGVEKERAVS